MASAQPLLNLVEPDEPAPSPTPQAPPKESRWKVMLDGVLMIVFGSWECVSARLLLLYEMILWTAFLIPVSIVIGFLCALFLWGLSELTKFRMDHPWMLFLCPVGGVAISAAYKFFGGRASRGNNLILDEIHNPSKGFGSVPVRMVPLVIAATLGTHVVGGSAGREGTAVQIGAACSSWYAKLVSIFFCLGERTEDGTRMLLMAGIAGGFGGVFGTPISGAMFALEVVSVGTIFTRALFPSLVASSVADLSARQMLRLLGDSHVDYRVLTPCFSDAASGDCGGLSEPNSPLLFSTSGDILMLMQVFVASLLFGIAAALFAWCMHNFGRFYRFVAPGTWGFVLHPMIAGGLVIASRYILGSTDYLGIGVNSSTSDSDGGVSIVSSFTALNAHWYSWIAKLFITAITLTGGFKGGEVTPLFFVGATAGNWLAQMFQMDDDATNLLVACGFVAVFGAATNTPLSSTMMGIELFGGKRPYYLFMSCIIAYAFGNKCSIYASQKNLDVDRVIFKLFERKNEAKVAVSPLNVNEVIEERQVLSSVASSLSQSQLLRRSATVTNTTVTEDGSDEEDELLIRSLSIQVAAPQRAVELRSQHNSLQQYQLGTRSRPSSTG